jgi:tetratricopeptide (TPR) repeat protein
VPSKSAADLETEESLARFQQLLRQRPFHGPAFEGLVKHAIDRGKLKDLVAEYAAKVQAIPNDAALRIVLARLQLRAGDSGEAGTLLDGLGSLPPELARMGPDLLVLKAEVYQRNGNNKAAEAALRDAQKQATSVSDKLRLGESLADLYLRDNRKEDAVAALNALASEFPDNYAHQLRIAEALAQRSLNDAALERFRAMLALAGAEADRKCEVLRQMGQTLERLNKRDEAIAAYTEAAGLLASDHWMQKELQERIVALYRAANRLEDLAKYCEEQIKRSPDQMSARILLADVQAAMGKPEEAKKALATAVELFPKDQALSAKRVEFLERLGDVEGVGAEYERIIGQNPQDTELYIAYGQSLANSRKVEGARNQWRHVLSTKVADPALAVRLGSLFEAYELYDDAAEAYERAITANPKLPDAYTALCRLCLVKGDPAKAAEALDRMGSANPDDGAVQAALAQDLRNLGKTDEALRAITRACELLPDQVRVHQVRSDLLIQAGQVDEGLAVRRTVIDRMTNPIQRADAIATLVSMYATGDRAGELKAREEKALADKPGDIVPLLILARIADTERNFSEMRQRIDAILAADPGNETALTQLAKLHDATGDINAATDVYTRLVQRYPARARQFYEAVVDLKLRYGDRAGAIETLQNMARDDQASAATQSAVADALVKMGEPERALPFFEAALKVQADRHESRLEYGKALVECGRLEDALGVFRAVAIQRADTDRAFEAIGRMHDVASQLGKLEELTDDLQQQVEADPSNTLVARAAAELYVRELEYSRALAMLDLVLKHNPRDVDLALTRAEVLRRLARFDEAVEEYQRVLRFPQTDRDFVLGELGKTYFESGQVDQARRLWKQVQNKLYSGTLLKNNGLLEEAIAAFEEGIRLKPDEYALHRNLIQTLDAAGKTPEALKAARRLLDLDPGNTMNIERLAEACVRAGDRAGAAQVAARLFSASVGPDKNLQAAGGGGRGYATLTMAMYQAQASGYGNPYSYGGSARTNLDRGIQFFLGHGLLAELEEVLEAQLRAQPDNALLKQAAAELFSTQLSKPERSLALFRELETATFPLERQQWLGQCSQRDFMRIKQYDLIATKPALRDRELAALEAKKAEELGRDELLELAVIRNAQGNTPAATELLQRAVAAAPDDTLALGVLTDLLVASEKFTEAEPHARKLVELLTAGREEMLKGMVERVKRDYVRSLPLEMQLRVNDNLLADIAEKWTLGNAWSWWEPGAVQATGYLRAKLTLATVCAETSRIEEARTIWHDLAPKRGPDADRWTLLGDMAQLHKQDDLAYEFYQQALRASKALAGDPLLRQVYTSTTTQMAGYGEQGSIDKSFGAIVEAFSKRDGLVELYDFLRDTDQQQRSRHLAEKYKLGEKLIPIYRKRVQEAAEAFRASHESLFQASPAYLAEVCKLAELLDRAGDSGAAGAEGGWDAAQKVYESYLADFPDELQLLSLLGEVAEARQKTDEAIEWERKVLDCKVRLSKRAREWSLRELALTPTPPQPLGKERTDQWSWAMRWSRNQWYGGSSRDELDRTASWMRLAQLYLTADNAIAAADAMQRAVADAADALQKALAESGPQRDTIVTEVLGIIQERHLTAKMLPVLRTLAVFAPSDEQVQLAYAEALEASGRKELALEVCNRMLRRGVSDLGVLTEVRRRVASLSPDQAPKEATIATLEAEAADKTNMKARLRLAKAYYYSLQLDKSQEMLTALATEAPHMEDVHDLLIDIYTLRGDTDKLIEALKANIARLSDDRKRRTVRWRLVNELLGAGRSDEAMAVVKDLGDPRDPSSYSRMGVLLFYFGHADDAIACFEQGAKNKGGGQMYGREGADFGVALARTIQGDFEGASESILKAVDEEARQQTQRGGMMSMYGMFDQGASSTFASLEQVFALYPDLVTELSKRLEKRLTDNPGDPQAVKLLMSFHSSTGRPDKARALLDEMAKNNTTDQALTMKLIDRAQKEHDTEGAIALAAKFIAQTPKPKLPPGVPPQYAGMMVLQSPRMMMICKLGDLYWDRGQDGDRDKAFETYKQIIDEKVDDTRLAYATICLVRGRTDEARQLVDQALEAQQVKPPKLLTFHAFIAALDGKVDNAFDALAQAAEPGSEEESPFGGAGGSALAGLSTLADRGGPALIEKFSAFVQERIKTDPNDFENYRMLAQVYRGAGRPQDALKVMEQAAAVSTLTQQALQQRLAWSRSDIPAREQIPLYEKLVELAERSAAPSASGAAGRYGRRGGYESDGLAQGYRDTLGSLHWDLGEKEQAEKLWTARMNVQSAEAHIRLGRLYEQSGDTDRADGEYQRASELDPDSTSAHMNAARAAFRHDPPDHQALLRHMLECFVRRNGATGSSRSRGSPYYSNQAYPGYYGDGEDESDPGTAENEMSRWALALAQDPQLSTYLADPSLADRAGECKIMLATLTGDWVALEPLLRKRIEAGTPDPVIWTLWSRLQERKGDLAGAAKSLEFLRRAALTKIGQHREQLKLVLAGKQLKEAAAGTRQAQAANQAGMPGGAGQAAMMYGGYSGYYGYDDYGGSGAGSSALPSLYIRMGDFARAERLYLISSGDGGSLETRLPSLASLMWQQKDTDGAKDGKDAKSGKERALELMRLALSLPSERGYRYGYGASRGQIERYASMLSENGNDGLNQAADLLVRAYRFTSSGETSNPYEMAYSRGPDQSMEQGEEQLISQTLFAILQHGGVLEKTLTKLSDQSSASPDDPRLAKLVLSLQTQGRKWAELRDSLAARAATRAADGKAVPVAETLELFHAECQLGHWDAALALIERLRKDSPRQADQWNAHEAFVQLMRNDTAKAVAAAEPLLAHPIGQEWQGAGPGSGMTILAAAGAHDRMADQLSKLLVNGELDTLGTGGKGLLFRLMLVQKQWEPALTLALTEFWRDGDVLRPESRWWGSLRLLAMRAGAAGAPLTPSSARPEDAALLALLTQGPAAGASAFEPLVSQPEPTSDALRGLLFACSLAGDEAKAAHAAGAVAQWLQTHRDDAWYRPTMAPLQRLVSQSIDQMAQTGTVAVPQSFGFSAQISQLLTPRSGGPATVTYRTLLPSYLQTSVHLLARSGDQERLRALLADHAVTPSDPYRSYGYNSSSSYRHYAAAMAIAGSYSRSYGRDYGSDDEDGERPSAEERETAFREALWSAGRVDLLEAEYARLGQRSPAPEFIRREETLAAVGKADTAGALRRERARAMLAEMVATDIPDLGASSYDSYRWYWYSVGAANQDVQKIRMALAGSTWEPDDEDVPNQSVIRGAQNTLWELAMADPVIAAELERSGELVGPDWGSTQTARQLVAYYRARRQPEKVVSLVEKTAPTASALVRSPLLGEYITACFRTKAVDRIMPVLDAAQNVSLSLQTDIDLAKLVALRVGGSQEEANKLEARLLAACVVEPRNTHRIAPELLTISPFEWTSGPWEQDDSLDGSDGSSSYGSSRVSYNRYRRSYRGDETVLYDATTVAQLASSLGVRYEPKAGNENLTLARIRAAYQTRGLNADAVRILDREIAEADRLQEKAELLLDKVECQRFAKQADAASRTARELERALLAESPQSPDFTRNQWLLSRVYLNRGWNGGKPDYAKALAALTAVRSLDASCDASRTQEVRCLYELGRYADAWKVCKEAMIGGLSVTSGAEPMFYAGLAACQSGDPIAKEAGKRLLRRAVYRFPDSALATKAQEFIDER